MSSLLSLVGSKFSHILHSIHLWITLGIVILLSALYYIDLPFLRDNAPWLWNFRVFEFKYYLNGSLFYFPYIYSVIVFSWTGLAICSLASTLIMIPRIYHFTNTVSAFANNIMFLIVPSMIVIIILFWRKWIQRERETFIEREAERRAFTEQILKTSEDERRNITHEIHDDTIQTLLALSNQTQFLLQREKDGLSLPVKKHLDSLCTSISRISEDLRRLCINLRPSILDDLGLLEALAWLINNLISNSCKTQLVVNGESRDLPQEFNVIIFRFVQEALSNVERHSQATEIQVFIDFDVDRIRLKVRDNGKGFILPKPIGKLIGDKKLGIIGMHERANMMGGTFDIYSKPGEGTVVSLEFNA